MKGTEPMQRPMLSIKQVAAYTGVSVHTLYTMVSQRRIPYVKMGRLTRFDPGQLEEWISQHTVRPVALKITEHWSGS